MDLVQKVVEAMELSPLRHDFQYECAVVRLRAMPLHENAFVAGTPVVFTEAYLSETSESMRPLFKGVFRVKWTHGCMVYVQMRDQSRLVNQANLITLPVAEFKFQGLDP